MLPKPLHAREMAEMAEQEEADSEVDGSAPVAAKIIEFKEVNMGKYRVEYAHRADRYDMVFHFYRAKKIGGPFPGSFKRRLWLGFSGGFNLPDKKKIRIDWVEEVYSWCVLLDLSGIQPPTDDHLKRVFKAIMT